MEKLEELLDKSINDKLIDCIISGKRNKTANVDKVKIRQIILKNHNMCQVTEYMGPKVIHSNMTFDEAKQYIMAALSDNFKQCQIKWEGSSANILVSSKGQVTIRHKAAPLTLQYESLSHNRAKEYVIPEGTPVDFLVDLGVMTSSGKIVNSKYDKFRQINRFLEFIRDIIPSLDRNSRINILDFGCGKSYLTFAMYYYLKIVNGFDLNIVGLDLKQDVITHCNELAKKYHYSDLHFLTGDVADYNGEDKIDMVVTLHACDTATDYALAKAVFWDADVILSVPCCQHEFNKTISNDLLSPALNYGIIKERIAALMTDGIRAGLLDVAGYDTQVLEFIDMEHTPKNLLIRGIRRRGKSSDTGDKLSHCKALLEELHVNSTLYSLLKGRGILN